MDIYKILDSETNGLDPDGYGSKEYIVSYEEAVRLKELGFNLSCKYFYGDGELHSNQWKGNYNNEAIANTCGPFEEVISAPTWNDVIRWYDINCVKKSKELKPEFDYKSLLRLQKNGL